MSLSCPYSCHSKSEPIYSSWGITTQKIFPTGYSIHIIRILRLLGFLFSSGFFSKEQILIGQYSYISRSLTWILILIISSLTLSYCIKLLLMLREINSTRILSRVRYRKLGIISIIIIRTGVVLMGWRFRSNLRIYRIIGISIQGWYWLIRIIGLIFLLIRLRLEFVIMAGFWAQGKALNLLFLESMPSIKIFISKLEGSSSEILYLVFRLHLSTITKHFVRIIFIIPCFILFLFLL